MDLEYRFAGQSLQSAMAKPLVLEVLREAKRPLQRLDIANAVLHRHVQRGGLPPRQAWQDLVKRSLWYLEEEGLIVRAGGNGLWALVDHDDEPPQEAPLDEAITEEIADVVREGPVLGEGFEIVYLYFLPNDRELARLQGRDVWECKIGRTSSTDARFRILHHKTSFAHPPIIGLQIRTDHSAALEREIQSQLREVDAEVEDSPGVEWFFTSPERVQRWYERRAGQLECLRATS
jgi:T5orf172 domain-containing protein